MGKGRTLAGFVVENLCRGRTKHLWISVSSDLHEDAKRDLKDLGLGVYVDKNCHNLQKKFKPKDSIDMGEGILFTTYATIATRGRLEQVLEWLGGEEFDGLLLLDECHKCKTIQLDSDGNIKKGSSATSSKIVEIQKICSRARVVYCSATSCSELQSLAFMSRLGLWGKSTEYEHGFNQFLEGMTLLGTGAVELNAMHLKSQGALQARTLSYETCAFDMVHCEADENFEQLYEEASKIWISLYAKLLKSPGERIGVRPSMFTKSLISHMPREKISRRLFTGANTLDSSNF